MLTCIINSLGVIERISWRDVQVGEKFSASTWIQTGERGQVIFARGSERIVYRPNTIATLESQGGGTRVGPIRGSVLLSMTKRSGLLLRHLTLLVVVAPRSVSIVQCFDCSRR